MVSVCLEQTYHSIRTSARWTLLTCGAVVVLEYFYVGVTLYYSLLGKTGSKKSSSAVPCRTLCEQGPTWNPKGFYLEPKGFDLEVKWVLQRVLLCGQPNNHFRF